MPSGTCREGFARPSTSKRQSEDLQTSAPLPNPALMRNQGGAGGATGPASAPGLCLGGARPGARRATPLGHADQPSSRVRQLGAGSWLPRAPSSSPAHRVSRLRPGHVIDFAGGPHSPPAQLGLASRCRPPLPLGTTAERPPDIRTAGPYQTENHYAMIFTQKRPVLPGPRSGNCGPKGVQHDGGDGAWSGLGGRPG